MNGLMEGAMKENGRTIICMARDYTHGKMVDVMMVNIITTGNMDMDHTLGKMAGSMLGNG